jgi:hypothetical protein
MEPLLDKIARSVREKESEPLCKRATSFAAVVLRVLIVVLYIVVAIYAHHTAVEKHYNDQFPSGRGFAVCVMFGFSAAFAFTVFAALKSGRVTIGKFGDIRIKRSTDPFVFYLALAGVTAVSLWCFYYGVFFIFDT